MHKSFFRTLFMRYALILRIFRLVLRKGAAMIDRGKISDINDFFLPPEKRNGGCVYFYRIAGCFEGFGSFIGKYLDEAQTNGVVIEGGIRNPTQGNLEYYSEILGDSFKEDASFISGALSKWLPRLDPGQNKLCADALYSTLRLLEADGKNENIRKNTYVKFMCWLYYRFEPVVRRIGGEKYPKILYEGSCISSHEIMLITALCGCGCDAVLLEYDSDAAYLKADPSSKYSDRLELSGMTEFPQDFSVAELRRQNSEKESLSRIYGGKPDKVMICNKWGSGKPFDDIITPLGSRKHDAGEIPTCFYLVRGTDDKINYSKQLYELRKNMISAGRAVHIENYHIALPENPEIAAVTRSSYQSLEQLAAGLAKNLSYITDPALRSIIAKSFVDTLSAAYEKDSNLNKLSSKGVYILCWLKRIFSSLYKEYKNGVIGCYIFLGSELTLNEDLFIRFLAGTPADVLILMPDLNGKIVIADERCISVNYTESSDIDGFPTDDNILKVGTAAYHAERELDDVLYNNSGLFRDRQYGRARTVLLETICEEIPILWDTELKYRSGFSADSKGITIPVIFAKISGVKNSDIDEYWRQIKRLITADTLVIKSAPYIVPEQSYPIMADAVQFLRNGKLRRDEIKACREYQYGFLREEMQEHILDKIQMLLDSGVIKDGKTNGREYRILSVCLSLNKPIVRMIQKFDFTKKNPKIIYIITTESAISLEDTIVLTLLSYIGFDVLFYVPTGYICTEKYYAEIPFTEHQNGEYMYDLTVPDFDKINANAKKSFWGGLFGKK